MGHQPVETSILLNEHFMEFNARYIELVTTVDTLLLLQTPQVPMDKLRIIYL